MTDEYTPPTAQIRGDYIEAQADVPPSPGELEELGREFDRWLVAALASARTEGAEPLTPEEFHNAIDKERERQIAKGYTAEHDREHGSQHVLNWAIDYARRGEAVESAALMRAYSEVAKAEAFAEGAEKMREQVMIQADACRLLVAEKLVSPDVASALDMVVRGMDRALAIPTTEETTQ